MGDRHLDKKRRMPWWTDRVFCKIKSDSGNGFIDRAEGKSSYKCLFDIEGSDHRPVMATFVIAPARRRRLQDGRHLPSKRRWRRLKQLRPIHRLYNEILDANGL